jgi:protein-S-isoprenylcysteine O-methyltransferase Ste14
MSHRSFAPLLLSVILTVGVVLLSWFKLCSWHGSALIVGTSVSFAYLAWIFWEARVSLRDSTYASVRSDCWTAEAYALSQGGTALTALFFVSHWPIRPGVCIVGGALAFGCGVVLRMSAVRELGTLYSHRVHVTDAHRIVQTGPYKWLRHPAYSGMLMAHVGFVALFFNWLSVALLFCALLPAIVIRIHVEERALAHVPGYAEFCRRRARLVPLIW